MTLLGNKLDEEITLRGITTLAILLGNNTLWEERYSVEMLMVTSLGIQLMYWKFLIDSAGDKKTSPRTIFPWFFG